MLFNNDIELDCLAAIKLNKGKYLIPEANNTVIIKPDLDDKKLSILNQNSEGLGTKIIRLLKKWNVIHKKPFKSYQLESLVYKIFEDKNIYDLDRGLKKFFSNGIHFLKKGGQIYYEIDNHL